MTVNELKSLLEGLEDNMEVVISVPLPHRNFGGELCKIEKGGIAFDQETNKPSLLLDMSKPTFYEGFERKKSR
jgi:hypothetical protein